MNLQKQQLKHEHGDRMVKIGSEAVTHALRLIPVDSDMFKMIREYLELIRNHDVQQIAELVRQNRKIKPPFGDRYREMFYSGLGIQMSLGFNGIEKKLFASITLL